MFVSFAKLKACGDWCNNNYFFFFFFFVSCTHDDGPKGFHTISPPHRVLDVVDFNTGFDGTEHVIFWWMDMNSSESLMHLETTLFILV